MMKDLEIAFTAKEITAFGGVSPKRPKVYETLYGQAFREARHLWISLSFNLFYIAHGANASLIKLPKSLRPWFHALT